VDRRRTSEGVAGIVGEWKRKKKASVFAEGVCCLPVVFTEGVRSPKLVFAENLGGRHAMQSIRRLWTQEQGHTEKRSSILLPVGCRREGILVDS
jgi:hypothetical protein